MGVCRGRCYEHPVLEPNQKDGPKRAGRLALLVRPRPTCTAWLPGLVVGGKCRVADEVVLGSTSAKGGVYMNTESLTGIALDANRERLRFHLKLFEEAARPRESDTPPSGEIIPFTAVERTERSRR
jgi:hypothetical protein